jgi:hypothetical protein
MHQKESCLLATLSRAALGCSLGTYRKWGTTGNPSTGFSLLRCASKVPASYALTCSYVFSGREVEVDACRSEQRGPSVKGVNRSPPLPIEIKLEKETLIGTDI